MGKSFEKKGKAFLFSVIAVCAVVLITVFAIFGAGFIYHRAPVTTYHGTNPFNNYVFTAFWTVPGSGRINVIGPTSLHRQYGRESNSRSRVLFLDHGFSDQFLRSSGQFFPVS